MRAILSSVPAILLCIAPACAAETITYSYDAVGRLIKVVHSGAVNNNVQVVYELDTADNRTRVIITGAP